MNVNKKLGRLKQWAGERMGGEVKTNTSDEFKALEMEMTLRHEGMERLHKGMTGYIKSMSKRNEVEDKEKTLAIQYLGSTMTTHGEDFEVDSEFGQCLSGLGRANERIARMQETYVANATSSWLESLERSLAQMKEYQAARKKLESRRLAFDTSQIKMQKSKKEDFRMEEELRSQRAKYEESSEDVYRRMIDIKEAEVDSVADLSAFLDAELAYYDRSREILLQLKRDWPASAAAQRRGPRSRSNTTTSFRGIEEELPPPEIRIPNRSRVSSAANSPRREVPGFDWNQKPMIRRESTFEGPRSLQGEVSPNGMPRLSRVPTDSSILSTRSQLRTVNRGAAPDVFGDQNDGIEEYDSYDRAISPAPSFGSRSASWAAPEFGGSNGRKAPPPPPPSRSKKPPPPPPFKRSALSTSEVPYA